MGPSRARRSRRAEDRQRKSPEPDPVTSALSTPSTPALSTLSTPALSTPACPRRPRYTGPVTPALPCLGPVTPGLSTSGLPGTCPRSRRPAAGPTASAPLRLPSRYAGPATPARYAGPLRRPSLRRPRYAARHGGPAMAALPWRPCHGGPPRRVCPRRPCHGGPVTAAPPTYRPTSMCRARCAYRATSTYPMASSRHPSCPGALGGDAAAMLAQRLIDAQATRNCLPDIS